MEQRGAPNYGTIERPYGEAVPPNFTPAQVAVHIEATSMASNNPPPAGQYVPLVDGWFARSQRNKPQTNSAGAAAFVLVSGGMNLAWSCGFAEVQGFQTNTHLKICWYIAAIIGALVSAFITHRMTRKPIYIFSAFLILVGGILFVSLPHEYGAIAAARYLNGFAVGLVLVPTLVLIGEEVVSSLRGMAAALLETSSFTIGIFLQISFICAYSDTNTIPSFQYKFGSTELHGIFVIAFAVITFLLSYFLVIESPVYYLLRNDENQAIDSLRRLQRPFVVTQETYQQLEEHKRYIEDNSHNSDLMLPALLKLCLYRGLVSLSFSPLIILGLLLSTLSYTGGDSWPFILFGLFLWLGSCIAAFLMDYIGRKKLMIIGALICGSMAIGAGVVYNDEVNFLYPTEMGKILILLFVMELFGGAFSSSSSAYLTEAFPLHLKTYYIAISFTVQMLVLIIITACRYDESSLGAYFITFGVFYVVAFLLGLWSVPETKKLPLREAQRKFGLVIHSWNE